MAATVTISNVRNIYDGQQRVKMATVTITGTLTTNADVIYANSVGLNTIDDIVSGVLAGTVDAVAALGCIIAVTSATVDTTGHKNVLAVYVTGSTTATGFAPLAAGTNMNVSGKVLFIGH